MDEPGRDLRTGYVRDQPHAPADGHLLVNQQINGQGTHIRADAHRRVRHTRRAGRHMHLAAAAPGPVQVMLDAARCYQRHLQLLIFGARHLQTVLAQYADHYDDCRRHHRGREPAGQHRRPSIDTLPRHETAAQRP